MDNLTFPLKSGADSSMRWLGGCIGPGIALSPYQDQAARGDGENRHERTKS